VGAESGDDDRAAEGAARARPIESTRDALDKLGAAGITRSVMLLNGLGGRVLSRPARGRTRPGSINATQPEFLATLVVSFPQGEAALSAPGFPELGAAGPTRACSSRWSSSCRRWS
jgi:hypothetical protein